MSIKYVIKALTPEGRIVDYDAGWDSHPFKWNDYATAEDAARDIEDRVESHDRHSLVILAVVR